MDPSVLERMRGRRAHSHTSQENLVSKDSSSDVSPREPPQLAVENRRRQRRHQHPPNEGSRPLPPPTTTTTTSDPPFVNQAFVDDERPLPPPIEDDDDDEEEQNIQHADRLVSHVSKQHRRVVNEVQQQSRKTKKKTTEPSEEIERDDPSSLNQQIREQQEILSKRIGGTDGEEDDRLTLEPLPASIGTTRDRSMEQILEMARKSRAGRSIDEDQQSSTLGSSRRFGASGETKLQKLLRQRDMRLDATQIGSPTGGDRSTRFDYDETLQRDIQDKQTMRQNRWKEAAKQSIHNIPLPAEQDDFFLKIWPEEKVPVKETVDTVAAPTISSPVTTADNILGGPPAPAKPDEAAAAVDESATVRDGKTVAEEKQPLLPKQQPEFGEFQLTQYQRAERPFDDDEERDVENKKFKYVIGEPLSLQQKLGDGIGEPRSVEDEGIFVGKKPVVPITSVHRTEKRILQESTIDNKPVERWFGPDGAITSLPDPTKFVPTRPLIDDLFDAALGREFYKAYTIDSEQGSDPIGADRYRMDVDLSTILFSHHHMMSTEHVLATRMKEMYEHYIVRRQQRVVQQLSDKIKALKNAEINCRTMFEQNQYSGTSLPDELRNRLLNYQTELRQTRHQRCTEMKLDRQLLQHLLETWKKIKELRRTQGYTTTSVKLFIKQLSGKKTKHYEQMQHQIEEEIEDEIALAKDEYKREEKAYAQVVKKKKLQDIRKKEARKRLDKKKRDIPATGENQSEADDVAMINEEEIVLPMVKPEQPKSDEIRTTILSKYQNAIRPADEPEILLELVYSEPISTDTECSALERARRYHLQTSSNILVRILINGKVIADTGAIALSSEFEARISQIFPCYVVRTPEMIKLELYEIATRRRTQLAELYLPVPEPTVTTDNYKLQTFEFSSNILHRPNGQTAGVGAGIPVPGISDRILYLEGVLNGSVAWGVQNGVVLVPPDYATSKAFHNRQMGIGGIRQDLVGGMQAVNLNSMKHLIDWIKQSNLDPYDPDNAFLINLVKDYTGTSAGGGGSRSELNALQHFRLLTDDGDELEQRQHEIDLDRSLRIKLLQARQEKIPDFRDYRRVPPHDYLVRKENPVFKNYLLRRQAAVDTTVLADQHYQEKRQTHIDVVRRQGERNLRKMREQVLARSTLTASRKNFHEMVIEENIPNITVLSGMLTKFYIEPTRPLYPTRRRTEQKKVNAFSLTADREVFILVNLIAAIDLPIRRDAMDREKTRAAARTKKNTDHVSLIRPYVEIQFQKKTYRTSTVDGPNPSWNEELRLLFRPPDNDFDASSLQRCRDILYINIFDQLDVDLPTVERERDQIINKRIARNWLGSVKIPFSNVYVNGRLEGSYRLSVPNPLLGYAREKFTQSRSDAAGVQPHASVLRMFVTMDPVLEPPETLQQSFDSTESLELLRRARSWVEELNKKFPDRDYKVTVSDINGRSVFIPRFLRPLPLPPNVVNVDESATTVGGGGLDNRVQCQRLARFVSMIPFLADSVVFPGICDIWETSDEFLRNIAGDDEEHAVLLNNYFLTLNKKSWIALGESIYSGPCCFVLTKEDTQRYPTCWSVVDGQESTTIDIWNPIRNIYLIANEENVWANIQEFDLPSRMNFDFDDSKCWRPFFDKSFPRDIQPWASVQPNDLHYEVTRIEDVETLQKHIYEVLREKIITWREPHVTRWNWNCQKRLQDLIKQKELLSSTGRAANSSEIEQDLVEFQGTHDIAGFPLQMPYTNIQSIVEMVYATKIFEHPTNEIEFALAVHIHPYPNNILAVWIYLANLTQKRTSTF